MFRHLLTYLFAYFLFTYLFTFNGHTHFFPHRGNFVRATIAKPRGRSMTVFNLSVNFLHQTTWIHITINEKKIQASDRILKILKEKTKNLISKNTRTILLSTADTHELKTTLALCQIVSQLGSPSTNNMLATLSYFLYPKNAFIHL